MKNSVFGPAPGVAGAKRSPHRPSIVIGPPTGLDELTEVLAGRRVVGVDPPVAEVADEDVAAERAERRRRHRHGPRRVEPVAADEPLEQVAVRAEHVDEPIAGTGGVIVLRRILLRERHVELATDVVDSERGEPGRDRGIGEAVDEGEVAVEHVDRPEPEVARVQELAGRGVHEREALVDGADVTGAVRCGRPVDCDHGVGRIDVRVPALDGSVFGREQEERRGRRRRPSRSRSPTRSGRRC